MHEFRCLVTEQHGPKVGFANDGPIVPDQWKDSPLKVMVYGKETYGYEGCEECPIMGNLDGWNSSKFMLTISRLSYGLNKYHKDRVILTKNELYHPGNEQLKDGYSKLALVEVKKTSNDGSTKKSDDTIIRRHSKQNKEFLKRQIEMIDPDIILCSGKVVYDSLAHDLNYKNMNSTPFKLSELSIVSDTTIIHSYHPSYSKFNLYGLYTRLVKQLGS